MSAEGKTIIPVARVRYGFGGGGGTAPHTGSEPGSEDQQEAMGGGGGGGVEVTPIGERDANPGDLPPEFVGEHATGLQPDPLKRAGDFGGS